MHLLRGYPENLNRLWTRDSFPKICLSSLQAQKGPPSPARKPSRILNVFGCGGLATHGSCPSCRSGTFCRYRRDTRRKPTPALYSIGHIRDREGPASPHCGHDEFTQETHNGIAAQVENANSRIEHSLERRAKTMDALLHESKSDLLRIWIPLLAGAAMLVRLFGGIKIQGCRDAVPTAARTRTQTAAPAALKERFAPRTANGLHK